RHRILHAGGSRAARIACRPRARAARAVTRARIASSPPSLCPRFMHLENLRLGFVSDRSAYVEGGVYVDTGVGRLIETLASRCGRLTFAMTRSPARQAYQDMRLGLPLDSFHPLPWLPSIARGFHKAWSCRRVIGEVERSSDAVIVQLPFAAPLALLGQRRPR